MPAEWRPACRGARWERQAGYRRQGPALRRGRARRAVDPPGPLRHKLTPLMVIVAGLAGLYLIVAVLLWGLQERITFPAPRALLRPAARRRQRGTEPYRSVAGSGRPDSRILMRERAGDGGAALPHLPRVSRANRPRQHRPDAPHSLPYPRLPPRRRRGRPGQD